MPANAPTSGQITAVTPQARKAERVNVFLDGRFAFGLPADVAAMEGLAVGDELSAARVEQLLAVDAVAKATDAALRLLAHRPRSTRELRDRLRQKGYAAETIDAAVAKLEGWRYVDDAEFARFWVANREANQPRGRRLLEQELRRKGVDRELIRETIAEAELDEGETALGLGRAKLRTYVGLEPPAVRRRLGAYLTRRGYGYDTVKPVLDQLLGELEEFPKEPNEAADAGGEYREDEG